MASSSEYQAIPIGTSDKPFSTPSIPHAFRAPNGNKMTRILLAVLAIAATAFVSSYYTRTSVMSAVKDRVIASSFAVSRLNPFGQAQKNRQSLPDICNSLKHICSIDPSYVLCQVCKDYGLLRVQTNMVQKNVVPRIKQKQLSGDICYSTQWVCSEVPESFDICPICKDLDMSGVQTIGPTLHELCYGVKDVCPMGPSYMFCPYCHMGYGMRQTRVQGIDHRKELPGPARS